MSLIYLNIKNHKDKTLPIRAIRRPARVGHDIFLSGKENLIGISSCRSFPQNHPWMLKKVSGWCHCFRDPHRFNVKGVPVAMISESDFVSAHGFHPSDDKEYDFIWACRNSRGQRVDKNFELLKECLPAMKEAGMRGCIVGAVGNEFKQKYRSHVDFFKPLPWRKLMRKVMISKFAFLPNVSDASPRFLAEALSMGVPAIVNEDIYGGWKYINNHTGEFFSGAEDVMAAIDRLYDNKDLSPRDWWAENYGPRHSSIRLASFLRQIRPDLNIRRAHFHAS